MRIFSLDTSFSFLNFSVIEDGKLTFLCYLDNSKKTLENLPKVLSDYYIKPQDYHAYAVSIGVGYITSVRIGITFIKSWAYLFKKPVVGYENLYIMARYTQVSFPKVPCLKVSNTIFYRVIKEDTMSRIKVGEYTTEGNVISLKAHNVKGSTVILEFFPFSAYGGLYAYEKLSSGFSGDDPLFLEPIYVVKE
ncbi:MAG: tRNA threonylcarbamoyladenosine biosynthesis protein TsaB [Hydrogenobacter sp.]|uniref:tRNA threonylcarbamoyladenosine biosynthesis protein TsaB n=1 Tax=Hydrogenobacter thermophilus TaxID=940 RepID=UPI0030F5F585